jgi:hypothetical protein
MKITSIVLAMLATGVAVAADVAPFQLKGVLNTGREKLFGLSTQTGDSSAWVPLGKAFQGYTLKSYDDAKSVLLFEHDGKTYELTLATAKIATADAASGTPATVADAAAVIDRLHFEEMMTKVMEQQKKMMTSGMSQQMAKQMGANFDPKAFAEYQSKVMDVMLEAMNPAQMKKDVTEIYAQTFTKEQLAALGDFYDTSAGQALNDKQPEIQQKLQAVMMPRIMAAMPKVQQLAMEFSKEQQAKAAAAAAAAQPVQPAPAPAAK